MDITIGSDKQIEWAKSIKAQWIDAINYEHAQKSLRKDMGSEYQPHVDNVRDRMLASIDAQQDAKFFIDNKNLRMSGAFDSLYQKHYPK